MQQIRASHYEKIGMMTFILDGLDYEYSKGHDVLKDTIIFFVRRNLGARDRDRLMENKKK